MEAINFYQQAQSYSSHYSLGKAIKWPNMNEEIKIVGEYLGVTNTKNSR
ncbi:hypothetical protein VB735_34280 [Halotia wernerae UHCC 0503]|nr:hypothetical protein [Halotia wernerae UHCC 0503]